MSDEIIDILQPLLFEKWRLFQKKLKYNWPNFAHYYYWIENAIKWKEKKPNILINIYCQNGTLEEEIYIGIYYFDVGIVLPLVLKQNDKLLYEMLTKTNIINWETVINISNNLKSIIPTVTAAIEYLKSTCKIKINEMYSVNVYIKPVKECAEVEVRIPEECYIKALDKSDIFTIHSLWPHKSLKYPEISTKFISTMIEMNGGLGLYLKENDTLVSWAIHNDWHGLGSVQTLEQHKKKGYAKTVVNALTKKLGKQEISVILFIVDGNTASETMFQNLDWKPFSSVVWINLVPNIKVNNISIVTNN